MVTFGYFQMIGYLFYEKDDIGHVPKVLPFRFYRSYYFLMHRVLKICFFQMVLSLT